jgi:hypothetical protein
MLAASSSSRARYQLHMRNAGIGSYSTAGGTEEPGKIRRAILYVTSEIVNGCSTDVVAEGEVAAGSTS